MVTRRETTAAVLASTLAGTPASGLGQSLQPIELPKARTQGGMPLMDALKLRRSTREYADRDLSLPTLSDLLWAAFGINRPSGDRTAPYWRHIMVIDVYVSLRAGVWVYDPKSHVLLPHLAGDIRPQTGRQDFVATAPLNLIYVAHGERMAELSANDSRLYSSVDTAFIGQNVYLYCASQGLASVFRGAIDYPALERALQLPAQQFVTFAQTVGYPRP